LTTAKEQKEEIDVREEIEEEEIDCDMERKGRKKVTSGTSVPASF